MKKSMTAAAAALAGVLVLVSPVRAAPPTVTPSPGYDARLQEQRAAAPAVAAPVAPPPKPVRGKRKRIH